MRFKREAEVLVVGAGPVGLFTALSLAERGVKVQIVDKEWRGSMHSYALALHPETLRLLDGYGIAKDLIPAGHRIERIAFYDGEQRVGDVNLTTLEGNFPFVLVVPQSALERALIERLEKAHVKVSWNHQASSITESDDAVETHVGQLEKFSTGYPIAHTEWVVTREIPNRAEFLVGADGYHSSVRRVLRARFEHRGAAETFEVFEFPGPIGFQHEARVVFHQGTTNVVWPLDAQRGRWSFQVEDDDGHRRPDVNTLREFVRERAPWFKPSVEEVHWSATAMFERRVVDRFGSRRIWLLGDAAHVTGPVGAQSMNIGMREAADLAGRISAVRERGEGFDLLDRFAVERRDEWRSLLDLQQTLTAKDGAPDWAREHAGRLLPCLPASGDDLRRLLDPIGLSLG